MRQCAQWSPGEEKILRIVYPYFANPMIAQALGKTEAAVTQKGPHMGLRKTARGRTNGMRYAHMTRARRAAAMDAAVAEVRRQTRQLIRAIVREIRNGRTA